MSLAHFSVKRPIFSTMVTFIIIILGIVSLNRLQIDLLPDVELPTLSIRTEYSGASPIIMERLVTQILEEIVATVPGVEKMTSQSSEGNSNIQVTFTWGTDIDVAAQDVQSRIDAEIDEFPEDISRPRISKFDIARFPVVLLGISSSLDPVDLTQLIEDQIRYRFVRLPGVAQVDVFGGFVREVRIELDPDRLKALGLPLNEIREALRNANLDLPAGKLEEGSYEVTLRAPAEFTSIDQIRDTVILVRNGASVRMGQIAEVKDTYEKLTRLVRVNQERGLRVAIRKQAQANTVDVAKRVLDEINAVNAAYPQIKIVPVINQGNFIEQSIANVAQSVLYGGGLAVLVLLFFLRNFRSTLVISLSIPISVIATFALIYFGGLTINLMTLGGLALGVGMMVDNSVVVLENIFRRRDEEKEPPVIAAIEGTKEVGAAIVASTITTLVIFLPLVFVRGVSGILFQELAYVIIFSLICSLLVSLSLVPMLASKLLKSPEESQQKRFFLIRWVLVFSESFLTALDESYRDLIYLSLKLRYLLILISFAILGGSLLLFPLLGKEFLPPSDEGEVRVFGKMEVGTKLDLLDQQTRLIENVVYPAVPEAISSVVTVGSAGGRANEASRGEIRLSLVRASQRKRSNTEIANDLRRKLTDQIPGMTIRTQAPQGQFLLERILGTEEGIKVEIRGYEFSILEALSTRVMDLIREVEGIQDVESTLEAGTPQQEIQIDRDKIADLGLSARDVVQVLETAVAGSQAGEFRSAGNSYRILIKLQEAEKRSLDEILDLTLTTQSGEQVALRNLVHTEPSRGPLLIDRKDQQRLVTVQANVIGRDMGSVALEIKALLQEIPLPRGYDFNIAGTFEEQEKSSRELMISLLLSLLFVYMVLACQYESLRDPVVVMISVPFAAVGVLVTLFLTKTTLNLQSYMGCIMLGGIVVNNAILLVDQAGQLVQQGMSVKDAVAEAGRRRLRPILMTTLTTILALIPLAMGIGEGAEAQAPLARAVVGGLTASTLITLVLIPIFYSLFHPESSIKREKK
jgi:HAE1 family hydrophobic/amphiphilic exporter-1